MLQAATRVKLERMMGVVPSWHIRDFLLNAPKTARTKDQG